VSVCLSLAEFPHYNTDPDVTWGNGRRVPLVVHYWADLQSVHGFRCYDNIARTRNVSECLYSLYACLLLLMIFQELLCYSVFQVKKSAACTPRARLGKSKTFGKQNECYGIRPLRSISWTRPIVTDRVAWFVCLSVCRSVCLSQSWALDRRLNRSRCLSRVDPRNHVLNGGADTPTGSSALRGVPSPLQSIGFGYWVKGWAVQHGWTTLTYVVWHASAQGGSLWVRDVTAPHLGVKSPKNLHLGRK